MTVAVKKLIMIIMAVVMCVSSRADASINNLSYEMHREVVKQILCDILNKKPMCMEQYNKYIEEDLVDELMHDIHNNKIKGTINNLVVDLIDVKNSETSDIVMMANFKAYDRNDNKATAYLMEFHIDKNGKIYGYNIWSY
jgi:hypothetical protein